MPRIAGLKHGHHGHGILKAPGSSALKGAASKKNSVISVMFDESVASECEDRPSQAGAGTGMVVRPIWEPQLEEQDKANNPLAKTRTWSFLLDEDDDLPVPGVVTPCVASAAPSEDDSATTPDFDPPDEARDFGECLDCLDRFVSHPNSTCNFYCDIASILCITYDLVTIPMHVFAIGETTVMNCFHAFTTLFWTMDFIRHFFKRRRRVCVGPIGRPWMRLSS